MPTKIPYKKLLFSWLKMDLKKIKKSLKKVLTFFFESYIICLASDSDENKRQTRDKQFDN